MNKRALLIGSQTGVLSGVHNDVNAVAERLSRWGFATELLIEKAATRQGILERYRHLIEKTEADDAVVIYYSGHGGRVVNPEYQAGSTMPRYYQYIVPFDFEKSTRDNFRGIMSQELSALLAQLTQKTRNATVILDCCHAARMSRGPNLVPRAWPRASLINIDKHLKELAAQGITLDAVDMESNPNAVRLVAAAPEESAYEYQNAAGKSVGLLTESFLNALDEAEGLKVSWRSLGNRVRERVLKVVPYQRPEVEGPGDRLLFELKIVDLTGVLPVVDRGGKKVLQGGRVLGVHEGDEYAIVPMGEEKPTPENQIAKATVESVSGSTSQIRIEYCGGHADIPEGASAFPVSTTLPRQPVRISASGEGQKALLAAIQSSRFVKTAGEEDPAEILAEVMVTEEQIDLRDPVGVSLIDPMPYNNENIVKTAKNLDCFARVQAMLNLRSGEGKNKLTTPYRVEWGRVVDGERQPLSYAGEVLYNGEPIYVQVINTGQEKIYFSLFDIGLAGATTLLTNSQPSGISLDPGQDYTYGHKEGEGLKGMNLFWDEGVPTDAPRRESLLVICSDRAQDLTSLEAKGVGKKSERGKISPLQEMMEQIRLGGSRGAPAENQQDPDVRYAVSRIDFQLAPYPAPAQDKGIFLLGDRKDPSYLLYSLGARGKLPSKIAIRLKELIVHNNRALLGATEIRVDTLVITGAMSADPNSVYKAETAPFTGIKDGARLPFDNLLVYEGPVAGFLDMAVWVSRNQKDSLKLADLFKTELNSSEFKAAAATLAGLVVAAPQVALVVGAVGASATLVNIGTKLLLKALGTSIGLYRTSYLAHEQFGVGPHPTNGLMRAQDFSFGFEIIAEK
jgi:hypothetical protein